MFTWMRETGACVVMQMDIRMLTVIWMAIILSSLDLVSSCDNPVPFVEIDPAEYDMTYAPTVTSDVRPLGFDGSNIVYYDLSMANPCVSISGVAGRHIEIMFETVPNAVLCFRDQTGSERCTEGRHQECTPASADTMTFEFYCDTAQGCSESDVTFWLRITRGDATDNEGMWCHWRDNKFPGDLLTIPPDFEIPDNTGDGTVDDAASALPPSGFLAVALVFAANMMIRWLL